MQVCAIGRMAQTIEIEAEYAVSGYTYIKEISCFPLTLPWSEAT